MQKNRLRSAKNVIFSLLCILVDRPMGGFEPPKPPLRTPLNVGNKPTFRTKTREKVLDLTLVNRCAWGRIVGWRKQRAIILESHAQLHIILRSHVYRY